jgi:ATP-dependent RNA helicase SUPV3L1/SUV3
MTDSIPTAPQPASTGRYSLADDGQILFQPDATNPLPGSAVGKIVKGEAMLAPTTDYDAAKDWLAIHIRTVLEPLFLLKQEAGEGALPEGAPREIGAQLYEHLGVMHRADLEDQIAKLDPETRKTLRSKGVRLGPILAFLPALVKPAAIKMRALLWAVWNDKALPVARPADGRVSEVVDPATIDRNFYRMIGYPVFGPRAIRIDMLDRVITDIYDSADKGVFEARHKYAEWLGTNLEGLYAILEAMGHRRLKDEIPVEATPETVTTVEALAEAPALEAAPAAEVVAAEVAAMIQEPAKPAVVSVKFMLKRGKMSDRPQRREKKEQGKQRVRAPKKAFDPNKPVMLSDEDRERIKQREEERQKERDSRPKGGDRDRDRKRGRDDDKVAYRPKDGRNARTQSNEGRVYTFESTKKDGDDDGNPFAILKNLKK